jgi:gamma-glutamyl phosphate reductase
MKQTAVEWLAETLRFANKELYAEMYEDIEQAKEMEKEQLKNVWLDGRNSRINGQDPINQIKNL